MSITDMASPAAAAILLSVLGHALALSQWEPTTQRQATSRVPQDGAADSSALQAFVQVVNVSPNMLRPAPSSPSSENPSVLTRESHRTKVREAAPSAPTPPGVYRPAWEVDQPPLPASEPSIDLLEIPTRIARSVRLRIYVDTSGHVVRVEAQNGHEDNEELLEQLIQVFADTRFIPGMDRGTPVSTYLDVEISPEPAPL